MDQAAEIVVFSCATLDLQAGPEISCVIFKANRGFVCSTFILAEFILFQARMENSDQADHDFRFAQDFQAMIMKTSSLLFRGLL